VTLSQKCQFFSHQGAYSTNNTDIHSVGNRIADFQANRCRVLSNKTFPSDLKQLPIHQCEQYLTINDQFKFLIIDDIRRYCLKTIRSTNLQRWENKQNDQAYFASLGIIELGRIVNQIGTPIHQSTLLHMTTNSIEYLWKKQKYSKKSILQQLVCGGTLNTLSISHLFNCKTAPCLMFQRQLHSKFVTSLHCHVETHAWLDLNQHHLLRKMMSLLFPPTLLSTLSDDHELDIIMCGGWTTRQSTQALKILNLKISVETKHFMNQLRLKCIEEIGLFYVKRKQIASNSV
jgi:hypothetical protein